ncbi:unnamed protein product (macronuclear) [Paramecium tetraurelia]|uniref:Chromosome undetermined scaffold_24, whole genome shotgun sequence n=1 Tax=Paramecium tetraurelia TaxID=5888 RepID=Q3SDE5_PARTE|nr:uncharacterized protein GSPATT00009363001 [Paramecium tetraurelia]CAI39413.1 EPI14 [Paramecium tetraurelia]CAK73015.1 unnamed protein product [Paramecium tetraurelia]|eukprot:XP_001440412.1 hypothetical protein (macronuclear) [Paramecium tetraurelia strain d4-2]
MYSYAPLGVSYASPLATSIARPVPVGYAAPVSYVQPVSYAAPVSYAPPAYSPIRGESRVEYVPYQKPVVELEEEVRTVQVPRQKWVTDYYPVEYQKEYIPQVSYEKQIDYVPVEKNVPRVDYLEYEREVRRAPPAPVSYASPLSYSYAAPVAPVVPVAPVAPLRTSYVAPTYGYGYAPSYSYVAPTFGYGSVYRY